MHRSDSAMLEGMLQTVKGMASQHDGKGSLSNSADAFGDSPPQRSLPPHYNDNHCGLMSDGGDGGGGLFLGDSSSGWGNLGVGVAVEADVGRAVVPLCCNDSRSPGATGL